MFNVPERTDPLLDVAAATAPSRARATTSEALLGLLTLRPMSGYELQRTIARTIGNFWQESFGQIYPALRRLAAEGLANGTERREPGSARPSQVYELTEEGRAQLRDWFSRPCARQVRRDELLLKIFFGRSAPEGVIETHLEEHSARVAADLARYRALEARLPEAQRGNPSLPYFQIAVRHGIASAEAQLRWCEESIATLRAVAQVPCAEQGEAIPAPRPAQDEEVFAVA